MKKTELKTEPFGYRIGRGQVYEEDFLYEWAETHLACHKPPIRESRESRESRLFASLGNAQSLLSDDLLVRPLGRRCREFRDWVEIHNRIHLHQQYPYLRGNKMMAALHSLHDHLVVNVRRTL